MSEQLPRFDWQRRRLARNPQTSATTLAALSRDRRRDPGVLSAVAENRNTPAPTLAVLAHHREAAVRVNVARNPRTPLAALAGLIHDSTAEVSENAYKNHSMPALMDAVRGVSQFAQHDLYDRYQGFLVKKHGMSPSLSAAQGLAALVEDGGIQVAKHLRGGVAVAETETLAVLAHSHSPEVRSAVVGRPNTDRETLDFLVCSDEGMRSAVARHVHAGADDWLTLVETAPVEVAGNKDAPPAALAKLACHREASVRRLVARNPRTGAETLAELALDDFAEVRHEVATNPNTPTSVLDTLARVPARLLVEGGSFGQPLNVLVHGIKAQVAKHQNASLATLRLLANDGCESAVGENPHAPADLLTRMAEEVMNTPQVNWSSDEYMVNFHCQSVMRAIAGNPSTPPKTLGDVADWGCQNEVAGNPNAPAALLIELAKLGYLEVDEALAKNQNAPAEAIRLVARRPYQDPGVLEWIEINHREILRE